jgi:hypothetical protein
MARLVELIDTLHLMVMFMFQQPVEENAYKQDQTRGRARILDENLHKTTHRNKIGQGEGGEEELSTKRSLLSSCLLLKQKKKPHVGAGGGL